MSAHTPGPWKLEPRNRVSHGHGFEEVGPFVVIADDGEDDPTIIAELQDDGEPGVALADANLCASAPELLEACQELLALGLNLSGSGTRGADILRAISVAVGKAEGR